VKLEKMAPVQRLSDEAWKAMVDEASVDDMTYQVVIRDYGKGKAPTERAYDDFILEYWDSKCAQVLDSSDGWENVFNNMQSGVIVAPSPGALEAISSVVRQRESPSKSPPPKRVCQKTTPPPKDTSNGNDNGSRSGNGTNTNGTNDNGTNDNGSRSGNGTNTNGSNTRENQLKQDENQLKQDFINQHWKGLGLTAKHVVVHGAEVYLTPQGLRLARSKKAELAEHEKQDKEKQQEKEKKEYLSTLLCGIAVDIDINTSHVVWNDDTREYSLTAQGSKIVKKHVAVQSLMSENYEVDLEPKHFLLDSDGHPSLDVNGKAMLTEEGKTLFTNAGKTPPNIVTPSSISENQGVPDPPKKPTAQRGLVFNNADEDMMRGIGAYYKHVTKRKDYSLDGFVNNQYDSNSIGKNTGLIIFLLKKVAVLSDHIRELDRKVTELEQAARTGCSS
jgi:hypothetical protein